MSGFSRRPAVMLCHWPGMYSNGTKEGFISFQRVVNALGSRFANETIWMKASEIGRYWAAKNLTEIHRDGNRMTLNAPFATEKFTLQIGDASGPVTLQQENGSTLLREVPKRSTLDSGTWIAGDRNLIACFDLPKGTSQIVVGPNT